MNEPTAPVALTLEESGYLCHLVLARIIEQKKVHREEDSLIFAPEVKRAILARHEALWKKLANANDLLIGKK